MNHASSTGLAMAAAALVTLGCATAPEGEHDRASLSMRVDGTVERFRDTDPTMSRFFDDAVGYAVFPSVGKGAVGVGAAYGRGMLVVDGAKVGYCDLTQGSIGFQLGGQAYSEIIFFETEPALESFKQGNLEFAAQASAVAAAAGASADAAYENGVAVFTMGSKGLMFEASIGGQKFSYVPK